MLVSVMCVNTLAALADGTSQSHLLTFWYTIVSIHLKKIEETDVYLIFHFTYLISKVGQTSKWPNVYDGTLFQQLLKSLGSVILI